MNTFGSIDTYVLIYQNQNPHSQNHNMKSNIGFIGLKDPKTYEISKKL